MTDKDAQPSPQRYGFQTGRFPSPSKLEFGRKTHTVYPVHYMVAVGDLTQGFQFYGPFDTCERARVWGSANLNLKSATAYHVYPIFDVREDA